MSQENNNSSSIFGSDDGLPVPPYLLSVTPEAPAAGGQVPVTPPSRSFIFGGDAGLLAPPRLLVTAPEAPAAGGRVPNRRPSRQPSTSAGGPAAFRQPLQHQPSTSAGGPAAFRQPLQHIMAPLVIALLLFHEAVGASWSVEMKSNAVTLHMHETASIPFTVNATDITNLTLVANSDQNIAIVNVEILRQDDTVWYGNLNVTGIFLGITKVSLSLYEDGIPRDSKDILTVTVIRLERVIDKVFTASVAILVSILYINFGCAMDWDVCKATLRRPIGPAIGFFCQFVFMPLSSYAIGWLLFPDYPELQIGMFFTGISPSGGASNIWTVLLEGNLNLSVTMTTMCTIAAFGMMPFWIFTLGRHIFARGEIIVPYSRIAMFAIGLVVPLAIGFVIQKKIPRLSKILVRIMKPFSIVLVIFIIIFAISTNLYLVKLFSLQIIIAGMGLPWLGFIFGFIMAWIFKQSIPDIKAISIETGIQNTGVAIFLLRFTLPDPAADLTTVVPVASAIMTPLPLTVLYLGKIIYNRTKRSPSNAEPALQKLHNAPEVSTITKPYED